MSVKKKLCKMLFKARERECRQFVTLYYWKGLSEGLTRNTSTILSLPILMVPLFQSKPLVASVIFTALSLTDTFRSTGQSLNSVIGFPLIIRPLFWRNWISLYGISFQLRVTSLLPQLELGLQDFASFSLKRGSGTDLFGQIDHPHSRIENQERMRCAF